MNELEQLLALLGAPSFAAAVASVTNFNEFLAAAQKLTDKEKPAEALAELQARAARAPFVAAVEKATGKQGDEAIGLIVAALASHAELPKAREQLLALQKTTDAQAFESLIAKAKGENKLTKASEDAYRAKFAGGEISLSVVEFVLANLTPIPALERREEAPPAPHTPNAADLKHDGKTWDELQPRERAALKRENPEHYAAMRRAAGLA